RARRVRPPARRTIRRAKARAPRAARLTSSGSYDEILPPGASSPLLRQRIPDDLRRDRHADLLPDLDLDLLGEVGVVFQELLGVLPALAEAEVAVGVPGAALD